MGFLLALVFGIFVLANLAAFLVNARKEKLELQQKEEVERKWQQEIIESAASLEAERQRLKGTGKVPFVDWEISFLESHTIKFRRPSPPRVKPIGWTTEWDKNQLLKQESCCFWCGIPLGGVAHRDHVEPLARGGFNHVSNLVMACPPCNLDKSASEPRSWIKKTIRISEERKLLLGRILALSLSTEDNYDLISNEDSEFDVVTEDIDERVEFEVVQLTLFDDKTIE